MNNRWQNQEDDKKAKEEEITWHEAVKSARVWFMWLSLAMIFIILIVYMLLIRTLRDKESLIPVILGANSSVYSSEKTVLVVICALFMFSYFVDFLYNAVALKDFYKHKCFDWGNDLKGNKECDYYSYFLLTELYYIVDPLPIMVILVVHWQNFRMPSKLDQSSMNKTANITDIAEMKTG